MVRASRMPRILAQLAALVAALSPAPGRPSHAFPVVTVRRLPAGAIQPQAVVDGKGVVHLVFFQADTPDGRGNLWYVRLEQGAPRPTLPMRVNSRPDTAGSVGTVRVAQIAVGRRNRVHVVWNGLGPADANGYPVMYVAYTRMNDQGTAFEPQRSLITWAGGIDGGSSVAADTRGNVYAVWHATAGAKDESGSAVFVARSADNGRTFGRERRANPAPTGACGCCGLRAAVAAGGALYIVYRGAMAGIHRDTMLLTSRDGGRSFTGRTLDPWLLQACPMSTYALAAAGDDLIAAWETAGRVYWSRLGTEGRGVENPVPPGADQKHPAVSVNSAGQVLVVWTEGTGWQRGGVLRWQVYDRAGRPTGAPARVSGVPVWGLATVVALKNGDFVIVY